MDAKYDAVPLTVLLDSNNHPVLAQRRAMTENCQLVKWQHHVDKVLTTVTFKT